MERNALMPEASSPFTLITADRLIDGSAAAPVERAAILIQGERIVALGPEGTVRAPEGAAVNRKAYGAATILPGLVDAHTHLVAPGDGTLGDDIAKEDDDILLLQAAQNARTLLHSGVTTLRENGAKGKVAFSLREGIRRRLAPGPRMVICGRPIAMTGGHMGYFGSEADGEVAVRAEVRKLLKEGADYIKIVASGGSTRTSDPNRASYTVAELAAMTDEARRHGKLTAAHCTSAESIQNCLDAGVDMIIHCIFTEPDGTFRFRPDLVERLAAAKAWVNPTLYVMKAGIERLREAREREGRLTPELVAAARAVTARPRRARGRGPAHERGRRADDRRIRLALGLVRAGRIRSRDPHAGPGRPLVFRRHRHRHRRGRRLHRGGRAERPPPPRAPGRRARGARRPHPRDHRPLGRPRRLSGRPPHRPRCDLIPTPADAT